MDENMESGNESDINVENIDEHDQYINESQKSIIEGWLKENWKMYYSTYTERKKCYPIGIDLNELAIKTGATNEGVNHFLSKQRLKFLVKLKKDDKELKVTPQKSQLQQQQQQKKLVDHSFQQQKKSKEDQPSQEQEKPKGKEPPQTKESKKEPSKQQEKRKMEPQPFQQQHKRLKECQPFQQNQKTKEDRLFEQKKSKEDQSSQQQIKPKEYQPPQQQEKCKENQPTRQQKKTTEVKVVKENEEDGSEEDIDPLDIDEDELENIKKMYQNLLILKQNKGV